MGDPVGLWCDWFGDGFGAHAENDLTALLTKATWTRGGSPEITGAAQVGHAVFTVQNPAGRFDPDNVSSPLYGKLTDGVRVWFGVNDDGTIVYNGGTVHGRFAGRITEISALPEGGAAVPPLAEIVVEDALNWYGRIYVAPAHDCSPPVPVAIVQTAAASASPVVLGAAPTPGNVLVLSWAGMDHGYVDLATGFADVPGTAGMGIGSTGVIAHPSFGGQAGMMWRAVQPGDGATWAWTAHGGANECAVQIAEISGLSSLGPSAGVASSSNAGTALSLAPTVAGTQRVVATWATRLWTPLNSSPGTPGLTPLSGTLVIGSPIYNAVGGAHDPAFQTYTLGTSPTGGTQTDTGGSQDGYWWGGIAVPWDAS